MANPIIQQINAELENLQVELRQFKTSVEYLSGAKSHVKEAVQTVNTAEAHFNKKVEELKSTYDSIIKLTNSVSSVINKLDKINFPERLDQIGRTVKDTIDFLNQNKRETLEELKKASEAITKADFDGRFKKLQEAIDNSIKSNHETVKYIESLNLSLRMDKLDSNISGILAAIHNVQSRVESVERNIGDKMKEAADKQATSINEFQNKLQPQLDDLKHGLKNLAKKQQINSLITNGLIALGVLLIMLYN